MNKELEVNNLLTEYITNKDPTVFDKIYNILTELFTKQYLSRYSRSYGNQYLDDIVQESLILIHTNLNKDYVIRRPFKWALSIFINHTYKYHKKHHKILTVPIHEVNTNTNTNFESYDEEYEVSNPWYPGYHKLTPLERRALQLRLQYMSAKDISVELKVPVKTVLKSIRIAKEKLNDPSYT